MLDILEVRTGQGSLLSLPLEDEESSYPVLGIEGLDPVKVTLVSSSFAAEDGGFFHSARREARNIKITLGLNPDFIANTVRSLRSNLYKYFMPKSRVLLTFRDDDGSFVEIVGRVETCEGNPFSQEPEMVISIMCFDPDFIDPTPKILGGTTTSSTVETLIEYEGSVETGIKFILRVNRAMDGFTIYNRDAEGVIQILEFTKPLVIGDVVTINTVTGDKGATLVRDGVLSSFLYGIDPQSSWIELKQGDNYIRVYADGNAVPYDIEYITRYGGL